jgi:hypothetical protein
MKNLNKEEIMMAAQDAAINAFPSYDGEVKLVDALDALSQFRAECPQIVDYLKTCQEDLTGFEGAYVPGTDESEETHWAKECPNYDHDCLDVGCGRSVSESYSFWGTLVVKSPSGRLVVAAEFNQNVTGGYGI